MYSSTVSVCLCSTEENSRDAQYRSVQRRGVPLGIVQHREAGMEESVELGLMATGLERLSFLIPGEHVRDRDSDRNDLRSTLAACRGMLVCDMNAETGSDIHAVIARCDGNVCPEQRVSELYIYVVYISSM